MLSIFKFPGRPIGHLFLDGWIKKNTMQQGHTYFLTARSLYEKELRLQNPAIRPDEVDKKLETEFASWFASHVKEPRSNVQDQMIKDLASGPLHSIRVYSCYYINGFKFHVTQRDSTTSTNNSSVCVKGSSNTTNELDYYGRLDEIIEVEYPALPIKRLVLFKCSWYDPTLRIGNEHLGFQNMQQFTCFKIKHLNEHECDVDTSHSKWVFPQGPITFLLPKKILK